MLTLICIGTVYASRKDGALPSVAELEILFRPCGISVTTPSESERHINRLPVGRWVTFDFYGGFARYRSVSRNDFCSLDYDLTPVRPLPAVPHTTSVSYATHNRAMNNTVTAVVLEEDLARLSLVVSV